MKIRTLLGAGFFLLLAGTGAVAQGTSAVPPSATAPGTAPAQAPQDWESTFFDMPAVALPLLQAQAAAYAPSLAVLELEKKVSQEEQKIAQKQVLNAIIVGGTYNYGNLASPISTDTNPYFLLGGPSTVRHAVGLSLNLPLGQVMSRHNVLVRQSLRTEQAEAQKLDRLQSLEQEVIRRYQEVLLAKQTLAIQEEAFLAARTEHELGERQFRDGQVRIGELSLLNTRYSQALQARATAASQYQTSFLLLESLLGKRVADVILHR